MGHVDAQLVPRGYHGIVCESLHQGLGCARVSECQKGIALCAHDPDLVDCPKLREYIVQVLVRVVGWQVPNEEGGLDTANALKFETLSRAAWAGTKLFSTSAEGSEKLEYY